MAATRRARRTTTASRGVADVRSRDCPQNTPIGYGERAAPGLAAEATCPRFSPPVGPRGRPLRGRGRAVVAVTPAFAVRHVGVTDADATGTTLAFDTELSNATLSAGRSLEQVAFALEVGGKRIVEGIVPRGVEVPPRGAVAITFPERIRYADLPGLLARPRSRAGSPSSSSRWRGCARRSRSSRSRSSTTATSIPKTPGVGLAGFRVISMNPLDAAVEVRVAVENENAFPLPPGNLSYRITLAGGDLSASEAALPAMAPGGKATVSIPLKISLRRAGTAVVKALRGDTAVVGLHALASVGPFAWPVDLEARLPTRP